MTIEAALSLAIAIILLTIKPGPGMLAVISRSLSDGFLAALMIAMGIVTVQILYFLLAAFSFTIAEDHLLFISILMKSFGAVYLFYVGAKGFAHLEAGVWAGKPDVLTQIKASENYLAGVAITLGNPFVILFYAALIPSILELKELRIDDIFLGACIIASLNLAILAAECALASKAREFLKQPKVVKILNIATSSAFIMIGLFIGYSIFPLTNFDLNF